MSGVALVAVRFFSRLTGGWTPAAVEARYGAQIDILKKLALQPNVFQFPKDQETENLFSLPEILDGVIKVGNHYYSVYFKSPHHFYWESNWIFQPSPSVEKAVTNTVWCRELDGSYKYSIEYRCAVINQLGQKVQILLHLDRDLLREIKQMDRPE